MMSLFFLAGKRNTLLVKNFLIFSALTVVLFYSCGISISPKITTLDYDGKNILKESKTVEIDRTKEIIASVSNAKDVIFTWKINDTVVLSGPNQNKFKFNNYRSNLTLNSNFFDREHTLKVEVKSQSGRSDIVSLSVKFLNRAPVISLPEIISPSSVVNINVSDPDEDDIAQFLARIVNSKGVEVFSTTTYPATINIANYTSVPDTYKLEVIAVDLYDKLTKTEKIIRTENNPPSVFIVQPYVNEQVPTSFTLKWRGIDPDPEDKLKYRFDLKKDSTTILSVTTSATEVIVPNLEYDTTYTALVTVFDSFEASSTASVTFKTISSPRYAYIISKSFDGKSILNIANISTLPSVKIEGFLVNEDNVQFNDFDVAEDYVYIVGGTNLYVVNASDKSSPKVVKKINVGSTLTAIKIYKNYAILGEGSTGIRIINLTTPSNPNINSSHFGKTTAQFNLETLFSAALMKNEKFNNSIKTKSNSINSINSTNSKIEITIGKIKSIKLSGTNAYIANEIGGLIKLNLSNLPNLTINDLTLLYTDITNDIDIGVFNNVPVVAMASGNNVKMIKLEDAEQANNVLPDASVTSLSSGVFDTELQGVRISNNELYAFSIDKIRKWSNVNTSTPVEFDLGSQFNDLIFVKDKGIVLDGSKGLRLYRNDARYEPNKVYNALDMNYVNNFIFAVGDGFYCNGIYVIDVRNNLDPVIREYEVGTFFNKIDVKMKATPKGSPEKKANIVAADTESNLIKLYEFDYNALSFTRNTSLSLTGYKKVYDVAIDAHGRTYVLGNRDVSGADKDVIEIFGEHGNSLGVKELPSTIDQRIPKINPAVLEPVEPKSIQVVVNYLSQAQKPSYVLVSAGRAGSIRYSISFDTSGNAILNNELQMPTSYYVVVEEEGGTYRLQRYSAGIDSAIATDRYFDRVFVADGDYNGVWILDRNGANLTDKDTDNLTRTPLFAGAPARNISWYGDLLFVSGGGAGVKIINLRAGGEIEKPTLIPFNGLTYAFHSEANDNTMVVATDKGFILYDISAFPNVKPISSLNLPMFKIKAK